MSYIPELRRSLVKAAERQAPQAAPAHAHRAEHRRPLAGIGLILASATAIFVAGLALVLAGHRPSPSVRAGKSSATPASVARALLAQVRVPAGAVPLSGDMTSPAKLGAPYAGLPAPRAVDLRRFWRIHGDPNTVLEEIQLQGFATSQTPSPAGSRSATWIGAPVSVQAVDRFLALVVGHG